MHNDEEKKRIVCQKVRMMVLTNITYDCNTAVRIYRQVLLCI